MGGRPAETGATVATRSGVSAVQAGRRRLDNAPARTVDEGKPVREVVLPLERVGFASGPCTNLSAQLRAFGVVASRVTFVIVSF